MFERFTDRARAAMADAAAVAREHKSPAIRRHHLLIALLDSAGEGSGSVAAVLADADVDAADLRAKLVTSLTTSETASGTGRDALPFTGGAKKALELSLREALSLGHNYIGREHLLLGVLRDPDEPLATVLRDAHLSLGRAREIVAEQSPPTGRAMRRRMRESTLRGPLGRRSTPALGSVIRRAFDRAQDRNATTGDLLVTLLNTPGTHFHMALAGTTLPDLASVAAHVDKLIEDKVPDGTDDAVKVEPSGAVTINDPGIASELKRLLGEGPVTADALREILRRLQG